MTINKNSNEMVNTTSDGGESNSNCSNINTKYYGLYMSIISGLFGAIGSCFGKIALNNIQQIYNTIVAVFLVLWYGTNTNTSSSDDLDKLISNIIPPIHPFLTVLTQTIVTRIMYYNNNDGNTETTNNIKTTNSIVNITCHLLIEQIIPRIICILFMILCNGLMVSTFLLSIQYNGTVSGTAMCTASNIIFSTFFGYIIFNEISTKSTTNSIKEPTYYYLSDTIQWWIGFSMILFGVIILSSTTTDNTTTTASTNATTQESSTIADTTKGSYNKVKTI